MSADSTFITNDANKILKQRISELVGFSKDLKFLYLRLERKSY